MKTYPITSKGGHLHAFEITSAWVFFWPLVKVLKSVEGVTEVKRQWFNEDRFKFKYYGLDAIINEPFGDNSRYWVGFKEPENSQAKDLTPLQNAFRAYNGKTIYFSMEKGETGI